MNHKCKNTGKTPLMHAAKHGDDEAVRYLLAVRLSAHSTNAPFFSKLASLFCAYIDRF